MADLATLEQRLAEAESAYHLLVTGRQSVEVQHGDMRKRYTAADLGLLAGYVADLKAQIAALGGAVAGQRRRAIVPELGGF